MHSFTDSLARFLIHSITCSPGVLYTRSFALSFTRSLVLSFSLVFLLSHLLVHSFPCSLSRYFIHSFAQTNPYRSTKRAKLRSLNFSFCFKNCHWTRAFSPISSGSKNTFQRQKEKTITIHNPYQWIHREKKIAIHSTNFHKMHDARIRVKYTKILNEQTCKTHSQIRQWWKIASNKICKSFVIKFLSLIYFYRYKFDKFINIFTYYVFVL